jgi:MFS transporter, ACS family, hexuronate transporter
MSYDVRRKSLPGREQRGDRMSDQNLSTENSSETRVATSASSTPAAASSGLRVGNFRWVICGLLLLGVTKNYMDRSVLSYLKGTLQGQLGWDEIAYSNLVSLFQGAYAVGMLLTGKLIDKLGTRIGYTVVMAFWSVASMAHAIGRSFFSFAAARMALGLGEAGVFPASIKTVAEWFPKKERALATGIFNAGTNVGAVIAAWFVPWVSQSLGWRWAFLITGGLGFAWLALWLLVYRKPEEHPSCKPAELAYIQSDSGAVQAKIKWARLLPFRQTWTFAAGKFLTDPIWWFYLFWVPDFLQKTHGLKLTQIGMPILAIYAIADVGSVAGGWLSSALLKRGASVNAARKITMIACAVCVLPIASVYRVSALWPVVLLIGLAAAGHQGFSANMYTLVSDMFPSTAVASVTGIGGMCGAIGGMLIAKIVGYILEWTGSYMVPFFIAAAAYPVAILAIHILSPKMAPAPMEEA